MQRRIFISSQAARAASVAVPMARVQGFPTQAMRIVVGFGFGGGTA